MGLQGVLPQGFADHNLDRRADALAEFRDKQGGAQAVMDMAANLKQPRVMALE